MLRKITQLFKLSILLIAISGGLLWSQPPAGGPMGQAGQMGQGGGYMGPGGQEGPREAMPLEKMKVMLQLSDDQVKSIEAIMLKWHEDAQRLKIKHDKVELDIREQMLEENVNLAKVKEFVFQKATVGGELEFLQVQRDINVKKILSPEQYRKWTSMMAMMKGKGPGQGKPGQGYDQGKGQYRPQ